MLHNREIEISEYWEKNNIFEKSIEERPKNKEYIFYDGPPFATGLPHYGHILGMTSKDLFPRYWTMKGYRVERKWGWDCHGLPIENIVEKKLGIKTKKEIEDMGIEAFNKACREQVLTFAKEWGKMVKKLGKWIDFENSYKTMDKTYMETIWWIFKELYKKGLIYEGKKVLMYCPRCQTPLAKAEIQMDSSYKEIEEDSVYVKFKAKDKDFYFIAWTTTPWTLLANVALAVNPELEYAIAEANNEKYIIAKSRLNKILKDYKIIDTIKGKELLGISYEPLYPIQLSGKAFYVIDAGNEISEEEGSGIVHMAAYGELDYEMIKKHSLPLYTHIGKDGVIEKGAFKGTYFKKADPLIIKDLESKNKVLKVEKHIHSYPFCYRCDTALFYNTIDSWFVSIEKIKENVLDKAKEINWHPSKIEKRFINNIKMAPDWNISRNRYWATAIPVWKCDSCNAIEVFGSIKELEERSFSEIKDLHKDFVDNISFKCNKCNGIMKRIPEVIDCWFESGAMPYASKHYPFENKDLPYPADFVSEYIAQVRTWFYYMHVLGTILFNKAPFKHIVCTGTILAEDGQKMSKSKGNFPDPNKIIEKFSSDALRFYLMQSNLMQGEDLNFNEKVLEEVHKKVFMILYNSKRFYEMAGKSKSISNKSDNILDKWIISRLNNSIKEVEKYLDNYNTSKACHIISSLISDISLWYIRRSRNRLKESDNARSILAYTLLNTAKIIAPISPFIAEDIYLSLKENSLVNKESIHLEFWPKYEKKLINKDLEDKMQTAREIVSLALAERDKANIAIKQPLRKLEIYGFKELEKEYIDIIKEEVNVKEIIFKNANNTYVILDTEITKDLIEERIARELIRHINSIRKKMSLTLKDFIECEISANNEIKETIKKYEEYIKENTQCREIIFKEMSENKYKVYNEKIGINIKVI